MKILHYALGFPPERTGGLVKYSLDLMNEQTNQGHEVVMAFPGRINFLKKEPYFKFGKRQNIYYAELMNSLPLPLIGNIKNPEYFMKSTNSKIFVDFFEKLKPDVIHIHTLMGLYSEFLEVAKERNIKIVFTTHDYFGISPQPKMYLEGHDFVDDNRYDIWNNMRPYGSQTIKLRIAQLSIYPILRTLVKKFKKKSVLMVDISERKNWSTKTDFHFQELKKYYFNMLEYVDVIHFNSSISRSVYDKKLPNMSWNSVVLPVSSNYIDKSGDINLRSNSIRTIAYIGPYNREKGFFDFLKFAHEFISKDSTHKAFIMGDDSTINFPEIKNLGRYDKKSLVKYLELFDLVILPSQWHETFGLIALEVLSKGTKVVVSKKMGVSDFLPENMSIDKISKLDIENIEKLDFNVSVLSISNNAAKIMDLYT